FVLRRRTNPPLVVWFGVLRAALGGAVLGKIVLELEQLVRPELLVAADPALVDAANGDRIQRIEALAALFAGADQARLAQDIDVLHDSEARQLREAFDDLGRGARAVA